jgi:hypothetical protein
MRRMRYFLMGPLDTKNIIDRLNPRNSKDFSHAIDADLEFRYCAEGVEACFDWENATWFWGAGRMKANVTLVYDEAHGEWWNGCPSIYYSSRILYDEVGTAFDVTSTWSTLPSQNAPGYCTDDGQFCLPCRHGAFSIEISLSKNQR